MKKVYDLGLEIKKTREKKNKKEGVNEALVRLDKEKAETVSVVSVLSVTKKKEICSD